MLVLKLKGMMHAQSHSTDDWKMLLAPSFLAVWHLARVAVLFAWCEHPGQFPWREIKMERYVCSLLEEIVLHTIMARLPGFTCFVNPAEA